MPFLLCEEEDAPGAVLRDPWGECMHSHTRLTHTGSVEPTAAHTQLAINMWVLSGAAFADRSKS